MIGACFIAARPDRIFAPARDLPQKRSSRFFGPRGS